MNKETGIKETGKKTKAPATAKTAGKMTEGEGRVKAAPKVAAKTKAKATGKTEAVAIAVVHAPSYEEIARLAERYWAERGWQDGYAEQDWLRASGSCWEWLRKEGNASARVLRLGSGEMVRV